MTTPAPAVIGTTATEPLAGYPYPTDAGPTSPVSVPAMPVPIGIGVPGVPLPGPVMTFLLARAYHKAQVALANHLRNSIANFWTRYIDPNGFANSFDVLRPLAAAMIDNNYNASAANAADYYQQARITHGLRFQNVAQQRLDPQYLGRVMNSMSAGTFFHQLKQNDPQQASEIASRALQGAGARLVLLGGRDTITNAVKADKDAVGWERIIDADACSFCSMLASRGGVYKKGTVDFRAHDHCHCTAQPVFRGQEPVGAHLYEQWIEVTRGKSGQSARNAWDKYWAGRQNEQLGPEAAGQAPQGGEGNGPIPNQRVGQPALPH